MTLHAALLDLWRDEPELTSLLPVASVFTGRVPRGATLPYAVLDQPSMGGRGRSDDSEYADVALRISVWAESYTVGQEIADAIERAFGNRDFDLDSLTQILDLRHESTSHEQESEPDQRAWRFVIQFSALRIRTRKH
jgi:hypothetical protein